LSKILILQSAQIARCDGLGITKASCAHQDVVLMIFESVNQVRT
jgi:hypothetical protein